MKANLHIQTGCTNGITHLASSYYTPPFKVADITEDKRSPALHLMLMNASPGVLDGDVYDMRIDVGEGCSLKVQTQSYQRLFAMTGCATQQLLVNVQAGASFHYLPHPVVPHKGADFSAANIIHLSKNGMLCWGEVVTCGRKLNGEVFQYSRYRNLTKIYIENKLVVKENLLLQPGLLPVHGIGLLEGYTHMASLIYLAEAINVVSATEQITAQLQLQPDLLFGITAAPVNGIIIRLLGNKAEQLYDCLKSVAACLNHD